MSKIQETLKNFDEKFPSQEILEGVDIGEEQTDVVPVGLEFINKIHPEDIISFIRKEMNGLVEKLSAELAGMHKEQLDKNDQTIMGLVMR